MAPYAHLAVYKVCFGLDWPESDILTGLDAAVADGADVISISIGEENMPFFQDSIAIASFQEKNAFFPNVMFGKLMQITKRMKGLQWCFVYYTMVAEMTVLLIALNNSHLKRNYQRERYVSVLEFLYKIRSAVPFLYKINEIDFKSKP